LFLAISQAETCRMVPAQVL